MSKLNKFYMCVKFLTFTLTQSKCVNISIYLTIFSSYHHDENKARRHRIEYLEYKSSGCFFGIYFRIFENKNFFGIFGPDSGSAYFSLFSISPRRTDLVLSVSLASQQFQYFRCKYF